MKRHAYLILAHTNFGQLRKLLELLDDPRNDIFVHVDGKADFDETQWKDACRSSRLTFTDRRLKVHWGGVSIMRAELLLDQDTIHAFFDAHEGQEFISMWKFSDRTAMRVNYYTLFPEGGGFFLTNLLNNIFKMLQKAVGFRINRDVRFGYASQWFSITDSLARYVLSREKWLEKTFRHTNNCDEVFLATLVCNSPFMDRVYLENKALDRTGLNMSNMRFIDWSRGESVRHPWTFRASDWDLLMSVPYLWARKFDQRVDEAIIDRIYTSLKGS